MISLVTGGAGLIGAALCRKLLEYGNKVICLDNFYSGLRENIEDLISNPNFTLEEVDISTISYDIECDEIYNLACPASPPFYQKDPIYTLNTSINGAKWCLELAKKNNIPVLQTSTSEVYGDPLVNPQPESYRGNVNIVGPRSMYDCSKRVVETYFYEYKNIGVDAKIVRIFNTFSKWMRPDDGRVVSNFIMQAIKGDPITIYGDGTQTRSFCYVDDTVNGLITLMKSDKNGPYNIGNPIEMTMIDFANLIIRLTNSNSKIIYKPLPVDDPCRRQPDISRANAELGWKPEYDIEKGLLNVIEYYKERYL